MAMRDIYTTKSRYTSAIKRLEKAEILKSNKRDIKEFLEFCSSELSQARLVFYANRLVNIAKWLDRDFREADDKDIRRVASILMNSDYSENTIVGFNISIKKFYKWLEGDNEEYPKKVKFLRTQPKKNKEKLPEDLLDRKDIEAMIIASNTIRDKALISVLYEAGIRVGELCSIQIKDVNFNESGVKIKVSGKTGERVIPLVTSLNYLRELLTVHPDRENTDSYLFVSTWEKLHPITYDGLRATLKRIGKRAGLKKRIHPHVFRHSRATELATQLTEFQMKQYFGWTKDSKIASVYVHLSARDLEEAVDKINKRIRCPRCSKEHSYGSKFCDCGMALDLKSSWDKEVKREKYDNVMNGMIDKLVKLPQFKEILREAVMNGQ